jgi:hypothetical protein
MKTLTDREKRVAGRMLDAGETPAAVAERLGQPLRTVEIYAARRRNLRKNRICSGAAMSPQSDQLCWACRLGSGRPSRRTGEPCPWAARGAEVPGWEAAKVWRTYQDGRVKRSSESYRIRACPLYEPEGGEGDV